jgi:aryl-alcohol dehydrogenase-like predicted oxidoreductase/enamine deaminase RidA (YjgF/YER057c/UK114 family)
VLDTDAAAAAMSRYVDAGLISFDMADHYGSAEEIAGRFAGSGRPAQFLTKWVPAPGRATREEVRTAVQRALERLRTDRLNLLQFHAWSFADPAWLDRLFWLHELQREGLIHNLGVTNFDTAHLSIAVASGIPIASNQVSYSVIDQRAAAGLTAFCLEQGIRLLAYGTVAGGFLSERWLGKPEPAADALDTWSRMKYWRFIRAAGGWDALQGVLRALDRVARRLGVSISGVACRFILERPAVCAIIIGARLGQSDHIRETLDLFRFTLDETGRAEIDAALSVLRAIPGDCGDEYRRPPYLTASGDLSHHIASLPPPWPATVAPDGSSRVLTGTEWEEIAGFCRALRRGNRIWVSGTTATHRGRVVGLYDPAAQLHFVIDRIEGALQSLGSRLEDVVRTRVYVSDLADWEAVARAHGERFRHILPANTLVEAQLVGREYLVEVEAEAEVPEG